MTSIHHCCCSIGFLNGGAFGGEGGEQESPLLWWISLAIVGTLQVSQGFCRGQASTWILWIYLLPPTWVWFRWRRLVRNLPLARDQNTWPNWRILPFTHWRPPGQQARPAEQDTPMFHMQTPLFLSLTRCDKAWTVSSRIGCVKAQTELYLT